MVRVIFESAVVSLDCLSVISLQGINCAQMIVCKYVGRIFINDFLKAFYSLTIISHLTVSKTEVVRNFCPRLGIRLAHYKCLFKEGDRFFISFLATINSGDCYQNIKILIISFFDLFKKG